MVSADTITIVYYTHLVSVILFLLHYLIKTAMLLMNSSALEGYTKKTKILEMIISLLFLGTGGYMLVQMPEIDNLMIIKLVMVFASIPIAIVGFKRKKKIIAVLALLLIIGAYGMAEISKKKRNTNTVTSEEGKAIYDANCVRCHGEDGKAGLMGSSDLTTSPMDVNEMVVIITDGKGVMAPYAGQLTPEQIQAVAKYVKSLKK